MGARVSAASPGSVPAPSLGVPPPPPLGTQSPTSPTGSPLPPEPLPEPGPGTFEDLHKKCKGTVYSTFIYPYILSACDHDEIYYLDIKSHGMDRFEQSFNVNVDHLLLVF